MHQLPLPEIILTHQDSEPANPKGAVMQSDSVPDAIFRLSVKTILRGQGRSVLCCAAYRTGCKIVAEDGSMIADYRLRKGNSFSEIPAPANALQFGPTKSSKI